MRPYSTNLSSLRTPNSNLYVNPRPETTQAKACGYMGGWDLKLET